MKGRWDVQRTDDLVTCMGDINGREDRNIGGFNDVHLGYPIGHGNKINKIVTGVLPRQRFLCIKSIA